jgi:hypothetical protein
LTDAEYITFVRTFIINIFSTNIVRVIKQRRQHTIRLEVKWMYNCSRKYLKRSCHFRLISVDENLTLKWTLQKTGFAIFGPTGLKWLRMCSNGRFL